MEQIHLQSLLVPSKAGRGLTVNAICDRVEKTFPNVKGTVVPARRLHRNIVRKLSSFYDKQTIFSEWEVCGLLFESVILSFACALGRKRVPGGRASQVRPIQPFLITIISRDFRKNSDK